MIVAISGAPGAGKSVLAAEVSTLLQTRPASFGDYVRFLAAERGLDARRREVLQDLGEREVGANAEAFVDGFLRWAERDLSGVLVVDGLRHVEVRSAIVARAGGDRSGVLHVHVSAPAPVRAARRTGGDEAALALVDAHPVEEDACGGLAADADLVVDGGAAARRSARKVLKLLRQGSRGLPVTRHAIGAPVTAHAASP